MKMKKWSDLCENIKESSENKYTYGDIVKIHEPKGCFFEDDTVINFYGSTGEIIEILKDSGHILYYVKLDKIVKIDNHDVMGDYFTAECLQGINK